MNKILLLFPELILIIISCSSPRKLSLHESAYKQGIEGYIYRISGNQMPSPDLKPSPPKGIKTLIYIYELTNINQVQRKGESAFYYTIRTKFVGTIESDTTGYFKVYLNPGRYSLFAKKDDLYYANWFDKDNNIAPVQVLPEKFTRIEFRIDYDAVY